MTFSKRERTLLVAAAAALGALVIYWFVLDPLLERRAEAQADKDAQLTQMDNAENLLRRRRLVEKRWREMLGQGLTADPGKAESQVLHALGTWADEARLRIASLRPERSTKETRLPEINLRAAGTGSMAAVSRFLWRLETADIPLKVKTLQISSRKEGADDLSIELQVSTLYLPDPSQAKPEAKEPAKPQGDEP